MKYRDRKFWLRIHLYLGLLCGAPLLIVGLTGAILAFAPEIQKWDQPEFYKIEAEQSPLPIPELIDKIQKEYPKARLNHAMIFRQADRPWLIFASEGEGKARKGYRLHVDPYTGRITKDTTKGGWAQWIENLHRTLAIGKAGRYVVAVSAILLMITLFVGSYLWLSIRKNFFMRWLRKQDALSWHSLLGIVFALCLAIIAFTGVTLTFNKAIMPFVYWVTLSPELPPKPKSTVQKDGQKVSLIDAFQTVRKEFPDAIITAFGAPGSANGVFKFHLGYPNEINQYGWEQVFVDQYSGEIVGHINYFKHSLGSVYQQTWWSLHTGELFGFAGRVVWAIAVFALPVLFLTGIRTWFKKKGTSKTKKRQRSPHPVATQNLSDKDAQQQHAQVCSNTQ